MYYLQSRYYNPEWGRFVNADVLIGETGKLLSFNVFAYCRNNPIKRYDKQGYRDEEVLALALADGPEPGPADVIALAIYAVDNLAPVIDEEIEYLSPIVEKEAEAWWINAGDATTRVYLGIKDKAAQYVGITVDVVTRQEQHGDRFDYLTEITSGPLSRRAARAIEQVLIENNPQFENAINSIGKYRDWYESAVEWGSKWLKDNGIQIKF